MTTKDKDWSHLTLDVYPSARYEDTTTLYEDDTISNEYKEGKFRTTELSTRFEDGKTAITIGAAEGSFDGDLAFEERDWTIRIHQPEGWGALKDISTIDGQSLPFSVIQKDADAMPFEIEGGAADGTVYEVKVSGNIYESVKLVAEFENPVDPDVPDDNYDQKLPQYEELEPVERTVEIQDAPYYVNLSEMGDIDWLHCGQINDTTVTRKKSDSVQQIQYAKNHATKVTTYKDNKTMFSYDDGFPVEEVTETRTGLVINEKGANFQFTIPSSEKERQLILYIGGFKTKGN